MDPLDMSLRTFVVSKDACIRQESTVAGHILTYANRGYKEFYIFVIDNEQVVDSCTVVDKRLSGGIISNEELANKVGLFNVYGDNYKGHNLSAGEIVKALNKSPLTGFRKDLDVFYQNHMRMPEKVEYNEKVVAQMESGVNYE